MTRGSNTTKAAQPPTFKGRSIGITALTILQLLIGIIHVFFGFWLLGASQPISGLPEEASSTIYSLYTVAFGFAVTIFAFGIWYQKKWGVYGTVLTSLFVTIADSLTLLNLPSIPGIPKFAAGTEIIYSLIIILYLFQAKVKTK